MRKTSAILIALVEVAIVVVLVGNAAKATTPPLHVGTYHLNSGPGMFPETLRIRCWGTMWTEDSVVRLILVRKDPELVVYRCLKGVEVGRFESARPGPDPVKLGTYFRYRGHEMFPETIRIRTWGTVFAEDTASRLKLVRFGHELTVFRTLRGSEV